MEPLLSTKFYIPPARPRRVPRPNLVERLNEGLGRKLTLVSAPAGFGKTTLVSEWVGRRRSGSDQAGQSSYKIAWLSLDEDDNNPIRFLRYLISALIYSGALEAEEGECLLGMLQSPQPPPAETVLTTVINQLAPAPEEVLLILDDYHLMVSPPIDEALAFLLEYAPSQLHLVIATREDPHLPLARLRARGQLSELRAADLRFSASEAAQFFNQVMGLHLTGTDLAALESRTEGWIAGLQLAALSMRGREDIPGFIQAFAGDHRYVVDYLVEEVLQRQPDEVRNFMLQTAILERLSAPLCEAVTGAEQSRQWLEALERGNLFLAPLDDQRQWYRYHHLFADVLRVYLMEEQPEQVPSLHGRASQWYERHDFPAEAVRHALVAGDFERAASLAESLHPAMDGSYQSAAWLGWVKALPDDLIRARPVLSVGMAWALLDNGQLEAAEARLRDAERWLEGELEEGEGLGTLSGEMVVVDEQQFRSLPAAIATARAYRAQALGDIPSAVQYAHQALELTTEADYVQRVQANSLLGLSNWFTGNLEAAERAFADCTRDMLTAGKLSDAMGTSFVLADIRLARGHLRQALDTCQQHLQLAIDQGEPLPLGASDLYRGWGELQCEQGDLPAANQSLARAERLGEQAALTNWQHRLHLTQARLKQAQGDLEAALEWLDRAARQYVRTPLPDLRPVEAWKARLWLGLGRLEEALAWARQRGLSADDPPNYLDQYEYLTFARLLIAQFRQEGEAGALQQAHRLLARWQSAAEEGGWGQSLMEVWMLQALAYQAGGDRPAALEALERALVLAEPQGYVRIFVDEGPAMAALLREAAKGRAAPGYARRLLAFFDAPQGRTLASQPLIEPLSERELEVLRLLRGELSGPEIAHHLMVSLNTLRTHTKRIYHKLGVNSRRGAVRRAQELDLL